MLVKVKLVHNTLKTLADGSVVIAEPLLTNLKGIDQIVPATAENKACGVQTSTVELTDQVKADLLAALVHQYLCTL